MAKSKFVLLALTVLVVTFMVTLITFAYYKVSVKNKEVWALSDLGGVFNSTFEEIDLSIEISGRLSDDSRAEKPYKSLSVLKMENTDKTLSQDLAYDNKLLCWGICRKPNNQTPDADPGAPELLEKYNGLYLGDTSKKEIYLTFDEGYENGYTPKILDVLKENKIRSIFFITGPYLSQHQDLVRRMVEEGHIVGNHTVRHPSLPSLSDEEIEEEVLGLERAFRKKFGKEMIFLRPPKGEYSERTLAITDRLGYINMFWSFAYDDWYRDKIRGEDYAYNKVMDNLHNGAILLLHAVSKDNADALNMIIKGAIERGYTFGDVKIFKDKSHQD